MAMMAMTTSNSISVKPFRFGLGEDVIFIYGTFGGIFNKDYFVNITNATKKCVKNALVYVRGAPVFLPCVLPFFPDISHFWLRLSLYRGFSPVKKGGASPQYVKAAEAALQALRLWTPG
jgi:hypothetical protein